jgi:hypothetical protein
MTQNQFRTTLARLKLSQGALARLLTHLGDTADPTTIRRRVERWAQGATPVPGEAAAFLNLFAKFPDLLRELRVEGWDDSGFGTGRPPRQAPGRQPEVVEPTAKLAFRRPT